MQVHAIVLEKNGLANYVFAPTSDFGKDLSQTTFQINKTIYRELYPDISLRSENNNIAKTLTVIPVVAVVGTVVTVLTVLTVGVVAVVADSVVNVVGALVLSTTHKHTRAFLSNSSVKNLQAIYR